MSDSRYCPNCRIPLERQRKDRTEVDFMTSIVMGAATGIGWLPTLKNYEEITYHCRKCGYTEKADSF